METHFQESIFDKDDLLPVHQAEIIIYLPQESRFSREDITMLDRLLDALQFKQSGRRYRYFEGKPDLETNPESAGTILYFGEDNVDIPRKMAMNAEHINAYHLPSLNTIRTNPALKRSVWEILKN